MELYFASVLLLAAQLASAEQVVNINTETDKALLTVNAMLTSRGHGLHKIPPLVYDDIEMYDGVIVGLNSQTRTGDATVTISEDSSSSNSTVDLHVGLRLFELGFGRILLDGEEMSGVFRVKDTSFHISFGVFRQEGNCWVELHNYEYERLARATFDSSLEKYADVDVSPTFTNVVLPRLNEQLETKKNFIQQIIQRGACFTPHLNFHQTNYFAHVLSYYLPI